MGMHGRWLVGVIALAGCQSFAQAMGNDPSGDDSSSSGSSAATIGAVTSGTPPDDSSSGDAVVDSSTGGPPDPTTTGGPPPAVCGDGVPETGEECDDGNASDADGCTSMCTIPTCTDGLLDGDETDVDCGGTCPGCPMGASCGAMADCGPGLVCVDTTATCVLPPSCFWVQILDPAAANGIYPIDPEGDGTTFEIYCDMTFDGGGWTRVYANNFALDAAGWSNTTRTDCGAYTGLLGGYGVLAGDEVFRTVDMLGVPHTEARLRAMWVFIDSWDGETAYGRIDGVDAFSTTHNFGPGNNQCGNGGWEEFQQLFNGILPHVGNSAEIRFGATLNQDAFNEAWGIDQTAVFVR